LEQHVNAVYRYALRLTRRTDAAEDVAQETLLRGLRNQTKLREPRAARLWLLRIATNVWNDQLRKSKVPVQSFECEPPCPRPTAIATYDERENVRLALAAMDALPPRQRQVLYLATCEELSHADIADVLGIEAEAVKSNLSLARKQMRLRLRDIYEAVCARPACQADENER
jgi:RNA polymerase sigma-70 factor (ECF subfamily)